MPLFKVVEFYPQAEVRRTLIVDAPTAQEAKEDPHSGLVDDLGYDVDEGGEAITEECSRVSRDPRKGPTAADVLAKWARKQGWGERAQEELALRFIEGSQEVKAFGKFLACAAKEEDEASKPHCKKCGSRLTRAGYCKDAACPYSDRKQSETYTEG